MNRNNRIIIGAIIAVVISLLLILYLVYIRPYTPKYKWDENYYCNSTEPYGTSVLYESLKASHAGSFNCINRSLTKQFSWEGIDNYYIFIGNNYAVNENEADSLFRFLDAGNTVFISTPYIPLAISQRIFLEEEIPPVGDENFLSEDSALENTTDEETQDSTDNQFLQRYYLQRDITEYFFDTLLSAHSYAFYYQKFKHKQPYVFSVFDATVLARQTYVYQPISYIDSMQYLNCISLKYGKGTLYLHLNPLFFTNYFLVTESGFAYANTILSLGDKNKIYWDEISKVNYSDGETAGAKSPFRYILTQPSFRWAWYLLLASLLLFLIFASQRRQKAIPLKPVENNSPIGYLKAVAAMYAQSHSHYAITLEMWNLFCVFVKVKYAIELKTGGKFPLEDLSKASGVDARLIEDIVKIKNNLANAENLRNTQLKKMEELLTNFYKQTK